MAINDLVKRIAVGGALLALLAPVGYGCGDDSGTESSNNSGDYTCQDACKKLIDCCKIKTGDPSIDCEESDYSADALNSCISACENDYWAQSTLDCLGVLYCNTAQDVKKCGGSDF